MVGPPAANRMRMRMHEHFQGPFGFGTPDDAEAWERVQRGAQAGPDLWIMVNRGLNREQTLSDGHRLARVTDENRHACCLWHVEEDDVGMNRRIWNEITLNEVVEFIWREADMLDRGAYEEWLGFVDARRPAMSCRSIPRRPISTIR